MRETQGLVLPLAANPRHGPSCGSQLGQRDRHAGDHPIPEEKMSKKEGCWVPSSPEPSSQLREIQCCGVPALRGSGLTLALQGGPTPTAGETQAGA